MVRVPELVVIVGPIASGKSTVARALAVRFREAKRAVAVVDLDDLVDTIGGFVDLDPERFHDAQVVCGELVGAWLCRGFDVIVHGPFFQGDENERLLHAVPEGTDVRRVLLLDTFDVALERVRGDPERVLSKYPEVLRRTYDRVESLLPTMPSSNWSFDATTTTSRQIVDDLAASLLGGER